MQTIDDIQNTSHIPAVFQNMLLLENEVVNTLKFRQKHKPHL